MKQSKRDKLLAVENAFNGVLSCLCCEEGKNKTKNHNSLSGIVIFLPMTKKKMMPCFNHLKNYLKQGDTYKIISLQ